ncbi:MAG: 2-oxo acid dehydrogenase subunit E2 [Candidatus Eremiobacteraeota bacterium]|nr:2-oxo acid dehydrogenase subunit E2 [Candidatus Eremiobacteraeota bacterium]
MSNTQVLMPQMGESIAEGTIVTWLKSPGDRVEKDEPLFEISTDKVDAEIPAPASGYLLETLFGPGETVEVNKVVAYIGAEKGGAAPAPAAAPSAPTPAAAPAHLEALLAPSAPSAASVEDLRRQRSSPLVRKMAQEHGVDIRQLEGTGVSGRVTKADLQSYLDKPKAAPAAVAPAASHAKPSLNGDKFKYHAAAGDRLEPFTPMRTSIAEHMVISRDTSVHVTTVFEIDMTRVVKLRAKHKPEYATRGVNLTYMPFIMKAVVEGLRSHPILNSSIVDNQVAYKNQINLGMAVALDWGLLVPVIKHADELSLLGMSRQISDLAERARTKKLKPDEVSEGTFTVTNPGVFGSLFGTPIINQPQVAILGVGTLTKRPVVTEDDAIAIRHMMYLALSFDHRVIDGATADRFMAQIKAFLQDFPEGLL